MFADIKVTKRKYLNGEKLFYKLMDLVSGNEELWQERYFDQNENPLQGIISHPMSMDVCTGNGLKFHIDTVFTGFFNDGHNLKTYAYRKHDIPFKSPMVRWENLNFCNGWSMNGPDGKSLSTDKKLIKAVINGLKPIGFGMFEDREVDKIVKMIEAAGLPYEVNPHQYMPNHSFIGVSQKGKIGELFDMDKFIESWKMHLDEENMEINYDFFNNLKDEKFEDFLKGWNYARPNSDTEFALTGLLLGYPIESTVSLLTHY